VNTNSNNTSHRRITIMTLNARIAIEDVSAIVQADLLPTLDHILLEYRPDLAARYVDAFEQCRGVLERVSYALDTEGD
jgi:hypothetical protein